MKSKVLTCITLLTLVYLNASAQMGKHYDADHQMSSSFTTQVYVDRDGFIWAATRNGLNRFDGYQYQVIKKEKGKDLGMASNYVNCMLQDRCGLFYVGMYGALQTYDGERFHDVKTHELSGTVVPCYITCLLQRQNGDILAGTSGHGLLKMKGRENAYEVGGALEGMRTVHNMIEDSRQNLWIATDNQGLWFYDGKHVKRYFQDADKANTITDVCEDASGQIFIATSNAGMFKLVGDTPVHIEGTGTKHISVLYVNRSGKILLGCDGIGLVIYDPKTGKIVDNPYFSREVNLATSKVYSIVEDLNGNLWLGLLQKGVYMQPANETGFSYMGSKLGDRNIIGTACVTSILRSSKDYIWVGTDKDGLYCLSTEGQRIKHFKDNFPATILGLCEDSQGRIWTGSYREGIGWIDQSSLTYHPYHLPQGSSISVFDIVTDAHGHLWIATMGEGLLRLDLKTNDIKAYTMATDAASNNKINSIVNNYISQLSVSPDGRRLYVATTMGVCALDIQSESWLKTFNGINCPNYGTPIRIAREYHGKLRIGTNDGLFCYNLKTHQMERHGIDDGLPDNGIASIEQDKKDRLWIATDHGLCMVNPKTKQVSSFFVDNGLQANEFSDGASWTTTSGHMLFGGLGGITWFNPDNIQQNEWKAEVKLIGFSVNGNPVTPATMSGPWQVTDTTVIASEKFTLSPGDNSFALRLSTLTYDNPEHIVYRYRINDEEWVRLQPGVNEITFSHLQPGTYHFCVVADRNDISTPERCFTVVIHAPWYRTPLAYIIYILAIAAAVWYYLKLRRRKEQDRLRLQEHIHAEEMADAKLKFFMNISHEIRTPMTLIVSPLQTLIKQDRDPHRRSVYETIRRNAERILGLINQMMDLRKIDKGQMQMRMYETELISFVGDIFGMFSTQAKSKNIKFTYEHDTNELPVWIDRNNFDKVVVNILSNAFKFTPTGGNINLRITHNDSNVSIAVSDSGEGIPKDKLDRIFERFYQSPSSVNDLNVGTGIGLDLTRSLVELHHGTITARNNENGPGSEFIVTIPLGNSHLKPEEMVVEHQETKPVENLIDDKPEEEIEAVNDQLSAGGRQRIVIVEDDAEIREYLTSELSADYDVVSEENGRTGLVEILKQVPDLVISDIMMPEMDGNTMCSKIKSNPATSHIPVIMLTAKSRDEDQLEGLEMGADAYIVKPFNMDILRRTIVNLIHSHQMLRLKYGRNDQLEEQVDDVKMKSPDDKLLERVMKVINKNLNNSDLSVDKIADEVGISRVHLHRKMKELTGQTPHDFIRNIRLKQAANLLSSNNMNITEVMYACGFNNAASFSTIFKKFYGMSPRDYMNEHNSQK